MNVFKQQRLKTNESQLTICKEFKHCYFVSLDYRTANRGKFDTIIVYSVAFEKKRVTNANKKQIRQVQTHAQELFLTIGNSHATHRSASLDYRHCSHRQL